MKLDEYVAIKVAVRTTGSGVFTAEARGPEVNGGPARNMEKSADSFIRVRDGVGSGEGTLSRNGPS
jgi:hypothetical protein